MIALKKETDQAKFSHSIELSGKSLKPAAGQDLKVEEPVLRRYLATLHFDGTLP